ncbi:MAG: 50S ribosomal protein L18Ae [Candidatus Syntrophoarchaeum caldarius]|uniref:Large ribosomal subunit protein eL20 n=1 Tax=Candidatus Syntropharchaeum caldarium TaxID=1838285 RepID=A0A1F2P9R2_9EURY|nr:MAG: 50S ribosomal protein L18Ae [Candidatus Syntrophoarchaeum caldarius]
MPTFQVKGVFKMGSRNNRFTKVIESNNEKNAIEKVYSLLGSEQRLKRRNIKIKEVMAYGNEY